jgi:hypothetical protein
MPLSLFRRNQGWLLWVIIAISAVVFIGFGLERTMVQVVAMLLGGGPKAPGLHRGEPLDIDEYKSFRQRWGNLFGLRNQSDEQAHSFVLTQMIMLREAEAAGVVATDGEVLDRIRTRVGYWASRGEDKTPDKDAPFDRAAYQQMLRAYDMTTATFERTLRERILVEKYQQAMLSIVRPNDLEKRAEFDKESSQLKAKYLSFRSDEFSELSDPTEEQVKEYFEDNSQADSGLTVNRRKQPGKYFQPNRVAIEYAYANFKEIQFELQSANPLPYSRVEKYYYSNREDYKNSDDEAKKGKPRYKSISEVYHEVVNKISEIEAKHIARKRMSSLLNTWGETASADMENLDSYLKILAEKYKAGYRGRTKDFSNRELNESTVGPIAKAAQVQTAAFKIYQKQSDGKPMSTNDALTYTSDLLESTDGVYVLRVVSQKPAFKPSWQEMMSSSVPNLDYEKIKDDLKVENGFQQAKKEAIKLRQAIYAMTVSNTAAALELSVQEVEASEDGSLKPDLGDAAAAINKKIFKADIGEIVLPFQAGLKRYLVLVTGGTEARRQAKLIALEDEKLKAYEFSPSDTLLEEYYETVKSGAAYKNADKIEAEFLQAKNAEFEGDDLKARAVLDAIAKDEAITKEATTTKEKAGQKDKIKDLAEKNKIQYGKNLDSFEVGDTEAMTKQLGTGIANAVGLSTTLDNAVEGKWSEIKDSLEGPFMIRVVTKTAGGPADFKDVKERVKEDLLSGWKDRENSYQFAMVWQDQLNASLSKVDTLDPIVKKTTKTFGARSSELFIVDRAPARFEDDKKVADAIRALKEGQLSEVLESDNSFVVGMTRDERTEKKVTAEYIAIAVDDFKPAADSIKDEDLKAHYEANKRTAPAEFEIEYVSADIAKLKAEIEKGLTSADKTDFFDKHLSDYYKGLDYKRSEPAVINDLSDERASKQAEGKIREAYDIVRKAAQKGDNAFEKVAERVGLTYKKLKFSRNNVHKVAAHLGSLQGHPQKAIAMANGDISKPVRTSTDHFIFRRLAHTPARDLTLDEVRADVITAVQDKKALGAAKAWAASLVTASNGKTLADGLKAAKYPEGKKAPEVLKTVPFGSTTTLSSVPSGDFRDAAVKLKKGDVFGPFETEDTVIAGAITNVADETRHKFLFVSYPFDSFRPLESQVNDEEVAAAYEKDKETYRKPDQFQLEYLFASYPELMESEEVKALATDEALKKLYEEKKTTLYKDTQKSTKEKVVSLPFDQVKGEVSFFFNSQAAEKLAAEKIKKAEEKVKAGEDLAAVAKELVLKHSSTAFFSKDKPEDPVAAFKDLEKVTDLAQIAAELKDGEIRANDNLKTSSGRALIKRKAFKKSYVPELAEVKEQVIEKVLDAKSKNAAKAFAEGVHTKLAVALKDKKDTSEKVDQVRETVRDATYLADSVVLPVVRETQLFSRPIFTGGRHLGYVPGLTGGNYELQTQFALAAFAEPRGKISAPVTVASTNTECILLTISGIKATTDEGFKAQRQFIGRYSQRDKIQGASTSWNKVVASLQEAPR